MKGRLLSRFDKLARIPARFSQLLHGNRLRQPLVRLLLGAPLLSLVLFASYGQTPDMSPAVMMGAMAALFTVSLILLLAEHALPRASARLRHPAALLDVTAISGVLLLGGAAASPLWFAYLWVVTVNGRRFGSHSLYFSLAFSLVGFSLVLLGNPYWSDNLALGVCLLLALTFIAPYLARRVDASDFAPPKRDATPPDYRTPPDQPRAIADVTAEPRDQTADRRQLSLEGKKILLLSNNRDEQQAIEGHLDSWGAATSVYPNSTRCFAALISAQESGMPFHALIAVHGQFDMDARQLASSIKAEPALQDLSLIHLGLTPSGELSEQLRAAGYARLLNKPLDKTLLFDAIYGLQELPKQAGGVVRLMDHYTGKPRPQPLSVLLADSDPDDLRRSKRVLQQAGHQVFVVEDGLRILDALESHRFDIAVVAIQLPHVSGLEVFKLYRFTRTDQPWMPFIMLLDKVTTAKIRECEDAGVDAVLAKPIASSQLIEVLKNTVQASLENRLGQGNGSAGPSNKLTRAIVIDGLTLDGQRLKELEQLGKGEGFLTDLVDNFIKENILIVEQMEQAVEHSDVQLFHDLGHIIKDGAGSLGTLDLYQLGVRATRLYSNDFPDSALRLLEDLQRCCGESHKALRHYLSSRSKSFTLHE